MRIHREERERQRHRKREKQAPHWEPDRSRVSRIRPWAEGGAKPLSHPGCPHFLSKERFYPITNTV